MVDPLAPVRTAPRAARPRRALRWVLGGSAAAAAVLALAVSSSRSQRDEPATESGAYQIHIKAPQQQPAPAAAPPAAPASAVVPEAYVPAETAGAGAPAAAPPHALRPPALAQREGTVSQRALREAGTGPDSRELGGGGDVSDPLARAQVEKPAGQAAPTREAAAEPAQAAPLVIAEAKQAPREAARARHDDETARAGKPAATSGSARAVASGSAPAKRRPVAASDDAAPASSDPAPGAAAPSMAEPASNAAKSMPAQPGALEPGADAAPSDARDADSPDALEEAARKSRREANYALAAAQYRAAARLRRGGSDASTPAWDLAHAIECLSAISQWDEARGVRRELLQRYPGEQSAASAAARALRPAELAPSSKDPLDTPK